MERSVQHGNLAPAGGRDQEGGARPRRHGRGVQRQHHWQVRHQGEGGGDDYSESPRQNIDSIIGVFSNFQTTIRNPCSGRSYYIETLTDTQTDGSRLEQYAGFSCVTFFQLQVLRHPRGYQQNV